MTLAPNCRRLTGPEPQHDGRKYRTGVAGSGVFAFVAVSAMMAVASSCAGAADLPGRPAYRGPPPVVEVYDWTGFYIGGNAGYGASDNTKATTTFDDGDGPNHVVNSFTLAPSGWLGGFQAGYNWQFGPSVVVGVEGDWQWANQTDPFCVGNNGICGDLIEGTLTGERKLQWVATARARLGWAQGEWLLYVTGGAAWGRVQTTMGENCPIGCGPTLLVPDNSSATFTNTQAGWVAGAGAELALGDNWSAKLEYLHLDLGTISTTLAGSGPYTMALASPLRDNIFRVGVNYRIDYRPLGGL